ncbi:MAG TPA: T9SS type A sorting domain-containing protein, partial [Bacteroidales bacterium]|nr:T9SS type A sorting domain-containing protein [Bacteroidales bacterium]
DSVTCGNEITVTDISAGETVISRAWYQDDILLTGDGPEEYTFSIGTINIADTVTVSLVVEGNTSADSVAHDIVCKEIPDIDAGDDFDVCGNEACFNGVSGGFDGSWLPLPGSMFDNLEDVNTCVTQGGGYGPEEFIWIEFNDECISKDTVTVTFWQEPTATLAMDPEDTAVCGKICYDLRAENPGSGVNGHWIANPPYGVTFFYQSYSDTMEVSEYGYYEIRWVESNHPDNEPPSFCSDTSDPWTVHFIEMPVADAGADTVFCGYSGELNAQYSTSASTGNWVNISSGIFLDDSTNPNATVTVDTNFYPDLNPDEDVFSLTWLETNSPCMDMDTVMVSFANIPSAEVTIIPPNCFGEPASIKANEDFHPEYNWELHGGIVDSIWPPVSDSTGNYRLLVHWPITSEDDTVHDISLQVQNRFGCWSEINDTVVYEPSIPGYGLEITPDSCLLGNGSVVFIPDSSLIAFHWIDTTGLNMDDPYDTVQTNIPAGTYDVEMVYEGQNETTWWPSPYDVCRDTLDITVGNLGFSDAGFTVSDSLVYMAYPVVYFSYEGAVTDSVFWYFGDGNTSGEHYPSHTYQESGIYTVTLYAYNSNDCGDISTKTIEVMASSSITTHQLEDVVIYPNPTDGRITVKSEHASIKQVQIFDLTGNKTNEVFYGSNRFSVDLTLQEAKGIYIIKLITESGTYFRRVVVQ